MRTQSFGGILRFNFGVLSEYDEIIDTAIALAEETDEAFAISVNRSSGTLGLSSETDTAFALANSKTLSIGLAEETDSAFSANADKPIPASIGLASETDAAFAVNPVDKVAIGLASGSDTAFSTGFAKSVAIGLASESDTAFSMGYELILFEDTFTESSDTALGSHTPDVGTSWNVYDGSLTVAAATDDVGPTGTNGDYRANTNDLGVTEFTIEAQWKGSVSGSEIRGWGVFARNTADDGFDGWVAEFMAHVPGYLTEIVGGSGGYATGSWPGTDAWMKAEITTSGISLYSSDDGVNWTLRRTQSGNPNPTTGTYAGIFFYDFGSTTPLPITYIKIYAS